MPHQHPLYAQTLEYLYEHLPQFSHLGKKAMKPKLDNILAMTKALNDPHLKYKTIHIAGTNGKGSTSHFVCAALMKAGYKVGLYTSPHLIDFRERIRINGEPISETWVVDFVENNKNLFQEIHPSYFEATVTMAFQAFAEEKVDVAVIETGLGGRLDSTNIVQPDLCIITNIDYDHKDVLGDTLPKIAAEKAGIFKPNVPVVVGTAQQEVETVFFEKALHQNNTIYYSKNHWALVEFGLTEKKQKAIHLPTQTMYDCVSELKGDYQKENIATALTAITVLKNQGWKVSIQNALDGIETVVTTTGIRGRWEIVNQKPLIIADVGHNPAGMAAIMNQWSTINAKNKKILFGFVKDKDVQEALSFFPKDNTLYTCQAQIPRAMDVNELTDMVSAQSFEVYNYGTASNAITKIINELSTDDALLITGSFFVVGDILQKLEQISLEAID